MATLWLRVLFIILSNFQIGYSTRFLPMIIWDHLNPILSCKCNWLTIPKIDEYDRVDFMCPSLKVAAKLLDGYSRPKSEMNENVFRRKWEGSDLNDLKQSLDNGSFCDPSKSVKVHTCRNGEEGKSLGVTFKQGNGYKIDSIFVFFNNGNNGKAASLTSTAKQCSMVFVVNITWVAKVNHDMSYGKCLGPNGTWCDKINATCKSKCQQGVPSSPSILPTSIFPSQLCSRYFSKIFTPTVKESYQSITGESTPTPTKRLTKLSVEFSNQLCSSYLEKQLSVSKEQSLSTTGSKNCTVTSTVTESPNISARKQSGCGLHSKSFFHGILVGLAIAIGIIIILIVCYILKNYRKGKRWTLGCTSSYPNEKTPTDVKPSEENPELTAEGWTSMYRKKKTPLSAKASNEKLGPPGEGFSNANFEMASAPPEHEYEEPSKPTKQALSSINHAAHSKRLPSIETCEKPRYEITEECRNTPDTVDSGVDDDVRTA